MAKETMAQKVERERRLREQAEEDEAALRGPPGTGSPQGFDPYAHPGLVESLIPVWGSGREAVADALDGDYAGAALNGALAASDLFLAGSIGKGVAKGGLYAVKGAIRDGAADAAWRKVRKTMGEKGMLAPRQHGHHWLIPQAGWGKAVPDAIKNHPLNINGMPSAEVHGRVHGRYKGKPRYNPAQRYWYGTPDWSKVATGAAVGHPVAGAKAWWEEE